MINSITITNHLDQSITMELKFPEKSGFFIRSIDGLGPSRADINMVDRAGIDGSLYSSSRALSRNIIFQLGFLANPTIEDTRQASYKYFPLKRNIRIKIESDTRVVDVEGYVESNEPDIFSKEEGSIISVICPESYLYDINDSYTDFSTSDPLFEFPWSNESLVSSLLIFGDVLSLSGQNIFYEGDAPVGIVIYIHAIGSAHDVSIINGITLETINIDSTELISITGSDIIEGDNIVISTVKGEKYATLTRGSTTYNILNALGQDPTWFELEKGDNIFSFDAETGLSNLLFLITNIVAYEGI